MSETTEVLDKVGEMGGVLAAKFEIVFGQLAEKMGQGAEYFWPIFVKQQVVEAAAGIGILGILIIMMSCFLFAVKRLYPLSKNEPDDWCPATIGMVIFSILAIGCFLGFCGNLTNYETILTGFINPEYAAIRDAVEMVSKL